MSSLDHLYNGSLGCTTIGTPQALNFKCYTPDPVGTVKTENYYHDVVSEEYPFGSSVGVSQLCAQGQPAVAHIDFARSSRAGRTGDCPGLQFIAFARDGISWSTFNTGHSAGVTNLTQAQLNGIFVSCTITEWGQINGNASDHTPIKVYTAQDGSGTRAAWDGFVGGNSASCPGTTKIFENNAQPIIDAGDQGVAIYPYSFGRWVENGGQGTTLGSVNGVAVNATTIANGTFPFGRFLYNVVRNSTSSLKQSADTKFYLNPTTGWLCKDNPKHAVNPFTHNNYRTDIESAITDNGFVPLPVGPIGGGVVGSSHCRVTSYTP